MSESFISLNALRNMYLFSCFTEFHDSRKMEGMERMTIRSVMIMSALKIIESSINITGSDTSHSLYRYGSAHSEDCPSVPSTIALYSFSVLAIWSSQVNALLTFMAFSESCFLRESSVSISLIPLASPSESLGFT